MYSVEYLILTAIVGYILGVVSTLFFTKKELTIEIQVSLLIMALWASLSTYGFIFEQDVPWLLDFAGFGATGNFIGIKIADLKEYLVIKRK